MIAGIAVHSLV